MRHPALLALLLATLLSLGGCGYNTIQRNDEEVKAAWAEVVNQYQRRADLVSNLVRTVQAEADFERGTLVQVVEARERAVSMPMTTEMANDPRALQQLQAMQGALGSALGRLLAVAESYPALRANQGFLDLQAQLEGTENRITVARKRYVDAVQQYNVTIRSFPSNLTARAFGYAEKPGFTVEDERAIARPPVVSFGPASASARP